MFKREFVLSIIGAIAGVAAFAYSLYYTFKHHGETFLTDVWILAAVGLLLISFIMSFIGAGLFSKCSRKGLILLILSGLLSMGSAAINFDIAWSGLLVFPIVTIAGVMAVSKRMPDGKAPWNESYVNTFDGLR